MTEHAYENIPAHVRKEQVYDFDIYTDAAMVKDLHRGLKLLHTQAPDIFYTPCNEGHWVVTRFDLMGKILRDHEHFSNRELVIPKSNSPYVMIPLNLDPPDHARYRMILMNEFGPKKINTMDASLRLWANRLIDHVIDDGRCDFTEALGAGFPVSVFMTLMGMPLERFDEFRAIVTEYFGKTTIPRRHELEALIFKINDELIAERRQHLGNDLLSALINAKANGESLTDDELRSMCFLLFIGGLDTVANGLTFAFRNLAGDSALQARLVAEPTKIPDFVEESLRCYAVVNQTRIVRQDIEISGTYFKAGDMVLCPLALAGLDERKNSDPMHFDIDRKDRQHMTFSNGVHMCVGNFLARREMAVFTEEWMKRVPSFQLAADCELEWRPGLVMALPHLLIEWKTPKAVLH